jgi:hypothetical protein
MSRTHFEQSVGGWSPKLYKWKFWIGNNDAHKMSPVLDSWLWNAEQGGRTSQEVWTCQTKIKLKTNTGLTEEGGTTIESTTTRGTTTRILILKSELRYSINKTSQGGVLSGGLKILNPR